MSTLTLLALLASPAHAERGADWIPSEIGAAPTTITMRVEIDAPIEVVWQEFSRIGDIGLNSPTVERSWLSSDEATGVGATRHMEMAIGKDATLDERVVLWTDGTYMALEVFEIHGVTGVDTMGGDFGLTARGDKTLLTSTLRYSMSNGFFGFMNRSMMKGKFARLWASVLAGYKTHIETGAEVAEDTPLDLKAVERVRMDVSSRKQGWSDAVR